MFTVSVKTNVDAVIRNLERKVQSQVAYATARALTQTAKDVQAELNTSINQVFDRPIPFTQKAVGIVYANKATLTSRVFLKDIQAGYLGLEVTGGVRTPKRRALVLPGRALPLNAYGNMPRGKIRALLARGDTFSGKVGGTAGIWQRMKKGGMKLLVLYEPKATYRKRFPFYEVALRTIDRRITGNMEAALQQALATMR